MPKTYNDIYISIRNALRENGVEAFGLEARVLLAAACGKSKEQLMRDLYLYTSEEIEEKACKMLTRRLSGEPLAYITGKWEFYGLDLFVTKDVLIPRMDTEVLVNAAIASIKERGMKARILDLCCGSGCIACAVSKEMPAARLVAADISAAALDITRKNVKEHNLTARVIPLQADAADWPPVSIGGFDLILSNPPYIRSGELIELESSVRDFEPLGALDGGEDGLDFYRAIIKYWTVTLRPNAEIMFEVGENQANAVKKMLLDAGYVSVETRLDTLGTQRVVIGRWKNEF